MTPAEQADLRRLMGDKAFLAFLYRLMQQGGMFAAGGDPARLAFSDGRRSLALDVLREIESVQVDPFPDGVPVGSSIQILTAALQSAPKEKPLGRRSSTYRDLDPSDDRDSSGPG